MAVAPRADPAPLIAARLLYVGFAVCVAGVVFAGADRFVGASTGATIARAVFGVVLIAEGVLLALNRWGARRIVVDRVLLHLGRGRIWSVVFSPMVWIAGAVFVAFGVVELARAVQDAL